MADTSNFSFYAVISDPDVRKVVRAELEEYKGRFVYHDEQTDTDLTFEANDAPLGSVDECFDTMLELIRDGVEEFECPACKGSGENPDGPRQISDDYWSIACGRCAGEGSFMLAVPDFPFAVHDEPMDEFLGTIRMHVPGLPDFSAECDADGVVRVSPGQVLQLVDEATDLATLRADVAALTGRRHVELTFGTRAEKKPNG
jgi:hypothetical protein